MEKQGGIHARYSPRNTVALTGIPSYERIK